MYAIDVFAPKAMAIIMNVSNNTFSPICAHVPTCTFSGKIELSNIILMKIELFVKLNKKMYIDANHCNYDQCSQYYDMYYMYMLPNLKQV